MTSGQITDFPLNILVVDDEESIRRLLQDILSTQGYVVACVETAAEALQHLDQSPYDVALIDLSLADAKGFDVVRSAKEKHPDLVAIIMSGMPSEDYKDLVEYQVDEYINKPFSFDELLYLIHKYERFIRKVRGRHEPFSTNMGPDINDIVVQAGHQLKSPVAVIKEFTHLFAEGFGGNLTKKQEQYLEAIHHSLNHMTYLLDNIENMKRSDLGGWAFHVEEEDPVFLIRQVSSAWRPLLEKRDRRLTEEFEDNLPKVKADATAVEQVLFNLVDNASKYSPAGSTIVFRCYQPDADSVYLEVENEGQGIAPDIRESIFQPYVRHAEHEAMPGLGLGLAIAQNIAEQIGGGLQLHEEGLDKGRTRFSLRLSIAK